MQSEVRRWQGIIARVSGNFNVSILVGQSCQMVESFVIVLVYLLGLCFQYYGAWRHGGNTVYLRDSSVHLVYEVVEVLAEYPDPITLEAGSMPPIQLESWV